MRRFLVLEHIMSVEADIVHSMEEPVRDFETEEEAVAWINKQPHSENFSIEDQLEDFNDYFNPEDDVFYPVDRDRDNYYSYADLEDESYDYELLHDDDMGN